MTSMEDDLKGRQPQWNLMLMEANIGGRQTQCSTAYKPIYVAKIGTVHTQFGVSLRTSTTITNFVDLK